MACEIQIVTRNRLVGRWVSSFKIPRVTFCTPLSQEEFGRVLEGSRALESRARFSFAVSIRNRQS